MKELKNKTLVLGASMISSRYSNIAIKRLLENNFPVEAIGKKGGSVNGIKVNTTKKAFENIDTITIYLNAKNQQEYYDYIIGLKPKRVIFNPGTENEEFENLLQENNIASERSCTLVLLSIGAY